MKNYLYALFLGLICLGTVTAQENILIISVNGAAADNQHFENFQDLFGGTNTITICEVSGGSGTNIAPTACMANLASYDLVMVQGIYSSFNAAFMNDLVGFLQGGGNLFFEIDPATAGSPGLEGLQENNVNELLAAISQPPITLNTYNQTLTETSPAILVDGALSTCIPERVSFATGGAMTGAALNDAVALAIGVGVYQAFWDTGFGGRLGIAAEYYTAGHPLTSGESNTGAAQMLWDFMQGIPSCIVNESCLGTELVSNADFETFNPCPDDSDQLTYAAGWRPPSAIPSGGSNIGTPDYFNGCAPFTFTGDYVGSNANYRGGRYAFSGDAFAGIHTYTSGSTSNKEYLVTELAVPLVAGQQYEVSFKYSLSNTSVYASDALGLHLGVTEPVTYAAGQNYLNATPQVVSPTGNFINNKQSWGLVSETYTALGGERFITVGAFHNNAPEDLMFGLPSGHAFYFIDDVSIKELQSTATVDAGIDVTINSGETITLQATATGGTPGSYSWSPATGLDNATVANPVASPTVTTTYTVTADFGGGCTDTDMVTVNVNSPPVNCSGTNLVINPSFENLSGCPLGSSLGPGCHPTDPTWQYHNNLCFAEGWFNATPATPDIISAPCAAASTLMTAVGEEYRLANSVQASRTGTNHAGIYTYSTLTYDPGIDNYAEYITIQLANPLSANMEYTVRFYVSLSDISRVATSLGAYFSDTQVQGIGFSMIQAVPNVETTTNITNMSGWVEVTGTFTASGGEEFLTIGRFNDGSIDDTQQVAQQEPGTNNDIISYYFIDDVSVTETLGTVTLDAGPDVTIDAGEGTQLGALPTGGTPISYTWTPATGLDDATIADPTASPAMTTTYTVTADFGGGCTATDQVTVTVVDPACPLMLSGGNVTEATCGLNDGSITGILVNGATGTEDYRWTDTNGTVVGTLLDLANVGLGSYTLTVTESAGCERTLTFAVNESGPPDLDDAALGLTDTTCRGTTGSITGITYIGEEVGAVFQWSDSEGTTVGNALDLEGVAAGTYTLQVTDAMGCRAIAGPYTIGEPADCEEELPEQGPVRIANTMTPNGDGSNDMFHIQGIEAYPNSLLQIYNRWGNKIYERTGYSNDWYGTYQGTDLPVATYYYVLSLGDEAQTLYKGYITILK